MSRRRDVNERFDAKVERMPNGCWEWRGTRYPQGYGAFWNGERIEGAHRFACRRAHGEIPPGRLVTHVCDNPPCVNPDHLVVGSYYDNVVDMWNKGRAAVQRMTHCKRGHEFTDENTRRNAQGHRVCRACMRIAKRRQRGSSLGEDARSMRARIGCPADCPCSGRHAVAS